ncbi:MAG: RNA polymerase sigma factor [Lewinellaceae bacterium]|nr:RNA polymerase sigma factor [Phaeodactylibacter sp.]MCB9035306.1 RNA polymerase sigma factor [Lewinellaceae bacterium]
MFRYKDKLWSTLADLIEACITGDEDALRVLFDEFNDYIILLLIKLGVSSKEDREDYGQEIWIKIFLHLKDLKNPDSIRSWIWKVVHHVVYENHRKGRILAVNLDDSTNNHHKVWPEEYSNAELIEQAISGLHITRDPENNRQALEVLRLSKLGALKQREIAEALQVKMGTVGNWISDGTRLLRRALIANGLDYDIRPLLKKYRENIRFEENDDLNDTAKKAFSLHAQYRSLEEIRQILALTNEPLSEWIKKGCAATKAFIEKEGLEKSKFIPRWVDLDQS